MKLVLDKQTFLWFFIGDEQLILNARKEIENQDNPNFLNVASLWEITIKTSLGKLTLKEPFELLLQKAFASVSCTVLVGQHHVAYNPAVSRNQSSAVQLNTVDSNAHGDQKCIRRSEQHDNLNGAIVDE